MALRPYRRYAARMKLADLAALAGVSTSTVSRALAGHPSISAATQARVQALAREHDVRPNQLARNLRLKSTGAIGLALPLGHARTQHLTDPFFLTLLGFLADLLVERGYDILLSRVIPDSDDWLDRLIDSGRIDGLLLVGQSDQSAVIERVAARYRPLVVWGANRPGQQHLTIGSDNVAGGRLAARRLLDGGRRRLLFVGDPAPPEFADRLAGFRAEAEAAGIAIDVLETAMAPDAVHAALHARLARAPAPDGLFAASDIVAMTALRTLAEAGVEVSRDAAVIGYDDVTLAAHTSPSLTTIRQDLEAGARLMVDALLARIAGEPAASAILPPHLIARASA